VIYEGPKMRTRIIIFAVLAITMSGCGSSATEQKLGKEDAAKYKTEARINQTTRQFVTGVKEVLETKKGKLSKEEQVSLDLTSQAERLLGGEPIEKMDVSTLLALNDPNNKAFDKEKYKQITLENKNRVTDILYDQLNNQTNITALQQQLKREKTGGSLWNWIKNLSISAIILLIIGVILLLIFAPNVLGWIIAKIPSLIFYLGVTSARVVKALVKGIQKARAQIAELPEGAKLDKYEILDMIDRGLKEEADGETTNTVQVLRNKYNLESISQKLKTNIANISKKERIDGKV
jgi:hypothetical protein